jgi:hypothetical protein
LRLVKIANIDAREGCNGRVFGGQSVEGTADAFTGVSLLQFQHGVTAFDGLPLQFYVPAKSVVDFHEVTHPGSGARYVRHANPTTLAHDWNRDGCGARGRGDEGTTPHWVLLRVLHGAWCGEP